VAIPTIDEFLYVAGTIVEVKGLGHLRLSATILMIACPIGGSTLAFVTMSYKLKTEFYVSAGRVGGWVGGCGTPSSVLRECRGNTW